MIGLGSALFHVPSIRLKSFISLSGNLLYLLDHRYSAEAFRNLGIMFKKPSLSVCEKRRIVKSLFVNLVKLAVEYIQVRDMRPENIAQLLKSENHQAVEKALRQKKGVLLLTAHLGNWEVLGVLGARLGYRVATVLKHQHNPYTDRWLTHIRTKHAGVKCFFHGTHLNHHIGAHLKQNGILALLVDQRDISSKLVTPFFGSSCLTAEGPAKLHLWYGAPMVFAFAPRQADGRYLIQFDGPYYFMPSGDRKADCLKIMTFVNQKYETIIRKYPEQWFSLLTPRWRIP